MSISDRCPDAGPDHVDVPLRQVPPPGHPPAARPHPGARQARRGAARRREVGRTAVQTLVISHLWIMN